MFNKSNWGFALDDQRIFHANKKTGFYISSEKIKKPNGKHSKRFIPFDRKYGSRTLLKNTNSFVCKTWWNLNKNHINWGCLMNPGTHVN